MALKKRVARDIVNALRNGTVPMSGLHEYAVGFERHMEAVEEQLNRISESRSNSEGRGDIKFIRGDYGAGKTFLTHLLMETALRKGFVVSNVVISKDTPMHKLDEVYHEIATNLSTPLDKTSALKGLLNNWMRKIERDLIRNEGFTDESSSLQHRTEKEIEKKLTTIAEEHSSFSSVLRAYYKANFNEDNELTQHLLGWLKGEKNVAAKPIRDAAGVKGKIDQTMALAFIRILAEIAKQAGRAGLVIILDEVETITRLTRSEAREQSLQNIRQIVDSVAEGQLSRCYFVFTGTPAFFEDRRGVKGLEPLDNRIRLENPDDPYPNYRQAQIVIPPFDRKKLLEVGHKVREIFETAYGNLDRSRASDELIESLADRLTAKFGGEVKVVPRLFLRQLVDTFDRIQKYEAYEPFERMDEDLAMRLSPENLSGVENDLVVM